MPNTSASNREELELIQLAKLREFFLTSRKVFWAGADGQRKLQKVTMKNKMRTS